MGIYDEYGYLGVQIKMNQTGEMKRFRLGDTTPLSSGLYFSHEGVVVIDGFELVAVYPYDKMWDKWGGWIGEEVKAIITEGNPVKVAIDSMKLPIPETGTVKGWPPTSISQMPDGDPAIAIKLPDQPDPVKMGVSGLANQGIGPGPGYKLAGVREFMDLTKKIAKEVEAEMKEERGMKPYWMVHRRGAHSGTATKVHHELSDAVVEAKRLARKEVDSFTILEAVMRVKPEKPKPVEVTVEAVGAGPLWGEVADEPEPECGYGCNDTTISSNCEVHAEPEPEICACLLCQPAWLAELAAYCEDNGPIPKSPCPCGCADHGARTGVTI